MTDDPFLVHKSRTVRCLWSHKRPSSNASGLPSCLITLARDFVVKQTGSEMQLDDLPNDALKRVFQQLSTNDRRIISLTKRKWQQLVAESWTRIDIRLGGTNYLDSASKQITWLLSLRLQRLHTLHLNLKGVELSGIAVDYLLFPFLDTLEQGAFSQLQTLHLSADMSLPGPLIHHSLQHLHLDMYALTAKIQCPKLSTLKIHATSMPGPTLFSPEALQEFEQLRTLHVSFQTSYLDDHNVSWFVLEGLSILRTLEQLILDLPDSVFINLALTPVLPTALAHLEIRCHRLEISAEALAAIGKLRVCLLRSFVLCVSPEVNAKFERHLCDDVPEGFKLQFGTGPFMLL